MKFRVTLISTLALVVIAATAYSQVMPAPAGIGMGPAPMLSRLTGAQFDREYVVSMFQLNSDIIALTNQGATRLTSSDVKSLSSKIRGEQMDKNQKLTTWARQMGVTMPPVNYARIQGVLSRLSTYSGHAYDVQYTRALITLLQQSRRASLLAPNRSIMPQIKNQALITVKATGNEITALQRWLAQHP